MLDPGALREPLSWTVFAAACRSRRRPERVWKIGPRVLPAISASSPSAVRGERDPLAATALPDERDRPVPALRPEVLHVERQRLADTEPVQGEEEEERVIARPGRLRRREERADLVAVNAEPRALVRHARSPDARNGGPRERPSSTADS
jgi:hypothetical protein